jgi:protein SCO1/2
MKMVSKLLAIAGVVLAFSLPMRAGEKPLPSDSVYQLDVQLLDQAGKRRPWRAQRGKPRLVAMFYTSCQYICPLIVDSGKAIEHQLTPAERQRIGITLISMDPARDTPKALAAVATRRNLDSRRWTLASPRKEDVRQVAGVLGVRYRELADGEFNHTSALVLLDADGRVLARTETMGTKPDPEFIGQVKRALARP